MYIEPADIQVKRAKLLEISKACEELNNM